jgi:hypothetical protein
MIVTNFFSQGLPHQPVTVSLYHSRWTIAHDVYTMAVILAGNCDNLSTSRLGLIFPASTLPTFDKAI